MFWDARFAPALLFLVIGVVALFQAAVTLRTGCAELPWGAGRRIEGRLARWWAVALLAIGGGALAAIPWSLG